MANGKRGKVRTSDACDGFAVVGIGASVGGVSSLEAFFSAMPADTDPGMAFVLVQHLLPNHTSILSDLIRRHTRIRVCAVEDGVEVRPNCAYIIPPGREMAYLHGSLQLMEPSAPRGQRLPTDFFFRSLAQQLRERAIGIVLSGTGSDGALGVRAIKGEGGMVMVQDPASAEYDAMPRSALATGIVDYMLAPAQMPAQLFTYAAGNSGRPPGPAPLHSAQAQSAIEKISVFVRASTGHDLSQYRSSTLEQGIERLMAFHRIEGIDDYAEFLKQTPSEVNALLHFMFLGTTGFFRNREAFKALETEVVPRLFADKPEGSAIRVWSPGCSTGEEAYSLAILLAEHQEQLKCRLRIQINATDIDNRAIAAARAGIYPAGIAADVSAKRLARFFSAEPDGSSFRIGKTIRDLLVFSEQDVLKDPPLSKLDLICCRNLLIYLNAALQKKLIAIFHHALNSGGFLFLGASETVGEFGDLFATKDRKHKIFRRRQDMCPNRCAGLLAFPPPVSAPDAALRPDRDAAAPGKLSLRQLTEQALLQQVVPAAALVNGNGDILYLHGRTGLYLEPVSGPAGVNNILEMAREGLRRPLSIALCRAAATRETVRSANLHVGTNSAAIAANLTVSPVNAGPAASPQTPLYLVVFEQAQHTAQADETPGAPTGAGEVPRAPDKNLDSRIAALEQQLRTLERRVVHPDGSPGSTVSSAVPILDEAWEIVQWLGTARDVTARREAERARERNYCSQGELLAKR